MGEIQHFFVCAKFRHLATKIKGSICFLQKKQKIAIFRERKRNIEFARFRPQFLTYCCQNRTGFQKHSTRCRKGRVQEQYMFLGKISSNFDLENMSLTYVQRIFHGKMAQSRQILKKQKKVSRSPDFYDKFQQEAQKYRRIMCFFFTFISSLWSNLAKLCDG